MTTSAAVDLSFNPTSRRGASNRRRRGHHIVGLLVTISIIAGAGAAAVVLRPRAGNAEEGGEVQSIAASPRNQRTLELLAAILGRCHEIIVVHPAADGTQTDMVLWLDDTSNPGAIDSAELGVITHSTVLQTIAFHHLDGVELEERDLAALVPRRIGRDPLRPESLTRAMVAERGFPNRWRALELVSTSILARGVSDLSATTLSDAARGGDLMRIELRWGPESADGADQASVLVDIGER